MSGRRRYLRRDLGATNSTLLRTILARLNVDGQRGGGRRRGPELRQKPNGVMTGQEPRKSLQSLIHSLVPPKQLD